MQGGIGIKSVLKERFYPEKILAFPKGVPAKRNVLLFPYLCLGDCESSPMFQRQMYPTTSKKRGYSCPLFCKGCPMNGMSNPFQ